VIAIHDLKFDYSNNDSIADFGLRIKKLKITEDQQVAIVGPSGSGKSTLLNLIAGIFTATSGTIDVNSHRVSELNDKARRIFRLKQIGMVFQNFELLDYLSVADNILLPYYLDKEASNCSIAELQARVELLVTEMGIGDKLQRTIICLSQGERQRVAICRALLLEPSLILADEPTGNLDPSNTDKVLDLLLEYSKRHQATLLTVTHDQRLLPQFSRVIDMSNLWAAPAAREDI